MCDVFETNHSGEVNDLTVDGSGRLIATAGEDRTIKVWCPAMGSSGPVCTLDGHEGAVVRVAWGASRFTGTPLLSIGDDQRVIVWKDPNNTARVWNQVYTRQFPAPLTAIDWAPHEYGEMFACSSADGRVYIVSKVKEWVTSHFDAHPSCGCTGVSWASCLPPSGLLQMPFSKQQPQQQSEFAMPLPRVVTCGNERSLRIWRYAPQDKSWVQETELSDLSSPRVSDVAWAPNVGLPFSYIAAGTDDGFVGIWMQDGFDGRWKFTALPVFPDPVARVCWSQVGTFLLVTCANSSVTMWKESDDGTWVQVSSLVGDE